MNGFLVIDKSTGMSSYDVIRRLKRVSPFRKIGYIGTLDRNATGVLPVAINEGVKIVPFFEDQEKAYRARFLLGVTTDTYDIEGTVLSETHPECFDLGAMDSLLQQFTGKISQQIPLYSSKKMNRKPLYKWAREGVAIEPPLKEVEIFSITLLGYEHPYVDVDVSCSKGTYIRTLARDFGEKLGCGATLFSLKRTCHGEFTIDMGVPVENISTGNDILGHLISMENVLKSFREVRVEESLERFLRNGMPIPLLGNAKGWRTGEMAKILNKDGMLIAVGMADLTSKTIKIKRLINN